MPSLNRFFGQCLLCITVACGGCASSSGGRAGTNQASGATKAAGFDSSMKAKIRATDKIVKRAANEYRLDPDLLRGMIWVESRFDPKATSPAGAKGLMQLMPATAKSLATQLDRRSRPYNSEFNVTAGAYYLRKMLNRYDGNLKYALAAYNAGPGNVSKWTRNGGRLPARSRGYVDKVLTARGYFTEKKLRARRMAQADAPTRAPHHEPAPATDAAAVAQAPVVVTAEPSPAALEAVTTLTPDAQAPVVVATTDGPIGDPMNEQPVFERRPDLDVTQPPEVSEGEAVESSPTLVASDNSSQERGPDWLPSVLD